MTVELLVQIYGAFLLSVVVGMAFGVRILRPDGKTYTPSIQAHIKEKQEVLDELALRDEWMDNEIKIRRGLVANAEKYDFRDDAHDLMEMLKKKYKSKDSQRKIRNIFVHIYNYYENRCKKCTK